MNTLELMNERHTKRDFARLKAVLACASKDATRHAITKVLVERDEDGITVTGTDGRRLRRDRFQMEAEPGIYDIKVCTGRVVVLEECTERLTFPDYRQVLPRDGEDDAYALEGIGKRFVLWATAGLCCWVDPALVELGDDEAVTLHLQKDDPGLGPVLARNADTTFVVMPMRLDNPWIAELEAIRFERTRRAIEELEPAAVAA